MSNLESEGGTSREELVQRLALMEAMISEGRCTTARYGWLFVLWGLVDLSGLGLQYALRHSYWVWPVVIAVGWAIQSLGLIAMRRSRVEHGRSFKSRSLGAVWGMMGAAVTLYVAGGMIGHLSWQISYVSAILMMVGLAHAISAVILRWWAQGVAAALWWAGGVATYFVRGAALFAVVVCVTFFGLVVFGLYAMLRERRRGMRAVAGHA